MISLVQPDAAVLEQARKRFRRFASPKGSDYLPLILSTPVPEVPSKTDFNRPLLFDYDEQLADLDKMLHEQLRGVIMLCRTRSDGIPSVSPRFGIGFLPSVFGVEQKVFADRPPWIKRHLSKDEISKVEIPRDLSSAGLIPQAIAFVRRAREVLRDRIPVGLYFMLSPIDIAFMARGEEIMTDMHDNPRFVHGLLEKTTDLFIRATRLLKRECGEPTEEGTYAHGLYMTRGGAMLCEDCAVMLSPKMHREFVIPYTRKALAEFGGGWVHFCGQGSHLIPNYYEVKELRGFLFGQLDLYDREALLRDVVAHGKSMLYSLPRKPGEPLDDYFRRALLPLKGRPKKGMVFNTYVNDPHDAPEAMAAWRAAQDRLL
ncbi:MAG: uroporphyrinogen decarboxylase family protein [Planctomycetota bacterium]